MAKQDSPSWHDPKNPTGSLHEPSLIVERFAHLAEQLSENKRGFRLDEGSSTAWIDERKYELTDLQFKVVKAVSEASTGKLSEKHILREVLGNLNSKARLRDTFDSRPGYLVDEGKKGVENALLVRAPKTRPPRIRLNIRKA